MTDQYLQQQPAFGAEYRLGDLSAPRSEGLSSPVRETTREERALADRVVKEALRRLAPPPSRSCE